MPQLMIDISAESAESLRLLAVLLTSYAGIKDTEAGVDRTTGIGLGQSVQAAVAAAHHVPMPYDRAQHDALEAEKAAHDAALVNPFKPAAVPQGTNVVPLFPLPPVLTIQTPVTPAALPPVLGMTVSAPVVESPTTAPATVAAGTAVELDKANIPWDARIHQTNRNKKADGTWMLKRGLDKAIAEAVLAELTAAKLATLPPAAPAAGPVSLPPVGLPVLPVVTPGLPGVLPTPPAGAQLPALPAGLPAVLTPVQRFSAMMVKINAAKASGQIDQSMIDEAHKALDLPQLQLAITQPDKIPLIEAALGL